MDALPIELKCALVKFVGDGRSYLNLSRTCRSLHNVCAVHRFRVYELNINFYDHYCTVGVDMFGTGTSENTSKTFGKIDRLIWEDSETFDGDKTFVELAVDYLIHITTEFRIKSLKFSDFRKLQNASNSPTFDGIQLSCETLTTYRLSAELVKKLATSIKAHNYELRMKCSIEYEQLPEIENIIDCRGTITAEFLSLKRYIHKLNCSELLVDGLCQIDIPVLEQLALCTVHVCVFETEVCDNTSKTITFEKTDSDTIRKHVYYLRDSSQRDEILEGTKSFVDLVVEYLIYIVAEFRVKFLQLFDHTKIKHASNSPSFDNINLKCDKLRTVLLTKDLVSYHKVCKLVASIKANNYVLTSVFRGEYPALPELQNIIDCRGTIETEFMSLGPYLHKLNCSQLSMPLSSHTGIYELEQLAVARSKGELRFDLVTFDDHLFLLSKQNIESLVLRYEENAHIVNEPGSIWTARIRFPIENKGKELELKFSFDDDDDDIEYGCTV